MELEMPALPEGFQNLLQQQQQITSQAPSQQQPNTNESYHKIHTQAQKGNDNKKS